MSHLVRLYAITNAGERVPVYCDGLVLQFSCGSELELHRAPIESPRQGVVLRSVQSISPVDEEPSYDRPIPAIGIQAVAQHSLHIYLDNQPQLSNLPSRADFNVPSRPLTAKGTSNKRWF